MEEMQLTYGFVIAAEVKISEENEWLIVLLYRLDDGTFGECKMDLPGKTIH